MLVTLDHTNHTYTDSRGRLYKSVSSLLSEYKHPFEPHKITRENRTLVENYAQKNGGTTEDWLERWEKNKQFACDRGHAFHSLKELLIANSPFVKFHDEFLPVRNINYVWNIIGEGNFRNLPPGVYTEVCCWDSLSRIAGTMDLLIIYPDKTFRIKDYKTNTEFQTESYNNRPMKYPFTNYPDCHIGHYTAQLSLYAWLLIQFGYKLLDLEVLHYRIPAEDAGLIMELGILPSDLEETSYNVAYCSSEIDTVISQRVDYLRNLNNRNTQ